MKYVDQEKSSYANVNLSDFGMFESKDLVQVR